MRIRAYVNFKKFKVSRGKGHICTSLPRLSCTLSTEQTCTSKLLAMRNLFNSHGIFDAVQIHKAVPILHDDFTNLMSVLVVVNDRVREIAHRRI